MVLQYKDQITSGVKAGASATKGLTEETDKARSSVKHMTEEQRKQAEETKRAAKELNEARSRVKEYGDSAAKGAKILAIGVLALGVATGKLSADFEYGMSKIATVADVQAVSIEKLSGGIRELSHETGQATADIQEGMYDAISAGVDTARAMDFMSVATKVAKGGFTDTKTAVDGLTTTLNAYNESADQANRIANEMMVAQNLGKTTFGEMAQSIGNVVPTSAALGVSTKELFSSMAVLTANGIKTSESVTGLKAAFSNIIKPTQEAADAAAAMGLKFSASEVQAKGWMPFLAGVKDKLREVAPAYAASVDQVGALTTALEKEKQAHGTGTGAYKNLQQQLKDAKTNMEALKQASGGQLEAFATMFGSVEALNSVLTLTSDQGMKLYSASMDQMGGKTDYVDKAYTTMMDNAASKSQVAMNSIKVASGTIGDNFLPVIAGAAEGIAGVATAFGNMPVGAQQAVIGIGGLTVGVAGLIVGTHKVIGLIKMTKDVMLVMKNATILTTAATKASALATQGAAIAQGAFNAVMAVNPIVWVVAGVVALGVGIALVIRHWDTIVKKVPALGVAFAVVKGVVVAVAGFIGDRFTKVTGGIVSAWKGVGASIKGVVNGVIGGVNTMIGGLNRMHFATPDWIPGIGGKEFGFSIPTIPKLARGTNAWSGGLAQIHERGGEIIDLPRGSRVYPHDESVRMARHEGRRSGISLTIAKLADLLVVREEADIDRIATMVAQKFEEAIRNAGGDPDGVLA